MAAEAEVPAAAQAESIIAARLAAPGDFVILWASYTNVVSLVLQQGAITNNKLGSFHHDDLIGLPFGTKVKPRRPGDRDRQRGCESRWLALLSASPELITDSLVHRTQIIYHADISLLLMLLDVCPGKVIIEAGTGSGSVSASFARALRPGGRLHTFEFHEERQRLAVEDFRRYGVLDVVTSRHRNVCDDGFGDELHGKVDGIFLDLPAPWAALDHVDRCLVQGGRICTFSPCIEQIDRTAQELRRRRYQNVRMYESLAVPWGVRCASELGKKRQRGADGDGDGKGGGKKGGGKKGRKGGKKGAASNSGAAAAADEDGDAADAESDGGAGAADEEEPSAAPAAALQPGGKTVQREWLSHQLPMRGHTSFLLVATKPPDDEP